MLQGISLSYVVVVIKDGLLVHTCTDDLVLPSISGALHTGDQHARHSCHV